MRICVAVPLHVEFHAGGCVSAPWRPPLCLETLRLRVAFERSGRTPKVSCSLNGTPVKIANFHIVGCSSHGSVEDKDWDSKLTPAIKEAAIVELARLYGGGASKPITIIGGLQPQEGGGEGAPRGLLEKNGNREAWLGARYLRTSSGTCAS